MKKMLVFLNTVVNTLIYLVIVRNVKNIIGLQQKILAVLKLDVFNLIIKGLAHLVTIFIGLILHQIHAYIKNNVFVLMRKVNVYTAVHNMVSLPKKHVGINMHVLISMNKINVHHVMKVTISHQKTPAISK